MGSIEVTLYRLCKSEHIFYLATVAYPRALHWTFAIVIVDWVTFRATRCSGAHKARFDTTRRVYASKDTMAYAELARWWSRAAIDPRRKNSIGCRWKAAARVQKAIQKPIHEPLKGIEDVRSQSTLPHQQADSQHLWYASTLR